MRSLQEVEAAKALMREAEQWSVLRWLAEKKRVREAADRANLVLETLEQQVKSQWSEQLRAAYESKSRNGDRGLASDAALVRLADDEARRAHDEAEQIFDRAEKRLSTSLAREGTVKAIASWELHERAITLAEQLSQKHASRA